MNKLLRMLFHPRQEGAAVSPENDVLELNNALQALRIELDARDQRIIELSHEVDRLRERQQSLAAETAFAQLVTLMADLAGPASQILTQADLIENQGKTIQARDVIAVARRAVRALERFGMQIDGQAGEQVFFDPTRHTPIGDQPLRAGQSATIRFAGVSYRGKILNKAIVE